MIRHPTAAQALVLAIACTIEAALAAGARAETPAAASAEMQEAAHAEIRAAAHTEMRAGMPAGAATAATALADTRTVAYSSSGALAAPTAPEEAAEVSFSTIVPALADELAAQIARFRLRRAVPVTSASRRGFQIKLGREGGVREGVDAEVLRYTKSGVFLVARATVIAAERTSSRLRRTDRRRALRVRPGDTVILHMVSRSVLLGGIGGVPPGLSQTIVSRLSTELRDRHGFAVKTQPLPRPRGPWPWEEARDLGREAVAEGLSLALAGWAEVRGDSLHLVLGLIDASSAQTVELYSGSAKIDAALASLIRAEPPEVGGASEPGPLPIDRRVRTRYETGLAPAFGMTVHGRVQAIHVLSAQRALCVANENFVEIYRLCGSNRCAQRVARKAIDGPSRAVPCRDPAGEIASLDSDGDGSRELVIWSSLLAGPVAFSISGGEAGGKIALERRETFWLPWAGPPGDARYVRGTNYMTTPSFPEAPPFYVWRSADLDGDGSEESVLAEASGLTTVRDSSMTVLSSHEGVSSPLELADMNGDGGAEIISSSPRPWGGVDYIAFHNWSEGDLHEIWRWGNLQGNITCLAAGLLDADDSPDLVAVLRSGPSSDDSLILFLLTSVRGKAGP